MSLLSLWGVSDRCVTGDEGKCDLRSLAYSSWLDSLTLRMISYPELYPGEGRRVLVGYPGEPFHGPVRSHVFEVVAGIKSLYDTLADMRFETSPTYERRCYQLEITTGFGPGVAGGCVSLILLTS